ncbi:MAG: YbhB/YbcL family Raf kinase inhibitor-like protein [Proteobacteria bacterium]|nr:YbhB/YbcL family Raf kinase inhibitor-like protein [Pseudomonadota bacterium]
MKLTSTSFADGAAIPGEFAFCIPDPAHHVCLGRNLNPQLSWSEIPSGTKSFALICHDPDVPCRGDDVNREERTVPASLPRIDFFHWHDMQGDYYGYDGPCPPWNDERLHHYIFTLYALDIERLPLEGRFGGPEVRSAIQGHILATASLTGTYTLNPALAA